MKLTVVGCQKDGRHLVQLVIRKPNAVAEEDVPTTARKVLIFRQMAKSKMPEMFCGVQRMGERFQFVKTELTVGTTHAGSVARVDNDDAGIVYFSVFGEQKESLRSLNTVVQDIGDLYGSEHGAAYSVECPRVNQACAVAVAADGGGGDVVYCRARVMKLHPAENAVTVVMVDDGEVRRCCVEELRLLPPKFMTVRALAVKAKLHGIQGYGNRAMDFLLGRDCHAFVEANCNGYHLITLYERSSSRDICINVHLVEKGWATCVAAEMAGWQSTYFKMSLEELMRRGDYEALCAASLSPSELAAVEDTASPCRVVSINSPGDLLIGSTEAIRAFDKMQEEMRKFYSSHILDEIPVFFEGDLCAVNHNRDWVRGRVISPLDDDDDSYVVWLTDHGRDVITIAENLSELKENFRAAERRGRNCFLRGIRVVGGQDHESKWSEQAVSLLKVVQCWPKAQFLCEIHDEGEEDGSPQPATLYVKVNRCPGPFETSEVYAWDVASLLVDAGVAEAVGEEINRRSPRFRWPPPELLAESDRLNGSIIYVDESGDLFVELDKNNYSILEIRRLLMDRFDGTMLRPQDEHFVVGDSCVVRYDWDDYWYRGVVVEAVGPYHCNVRLIDYGTVYYGVPIERMRKDTILRDTPALNTRVKMSFELADGVDMATVHAKVVGKEVTIVLSEPPRERGRPVIGSIVCHGTRIEEFLAFEGLVHVCDDV
jgi:hypothetical protein